MISVMKCPNVQIPPHFGGIAHLLPEQFALSDLRTNYGGNKPGYEEIRLLEIWDAQCGLQVFQ